MQRAETKERWRQHIEGDAYTPPPPSAPRGQRGAHRGDLLSDILALTTLRMCRSEQALGEGGGQGRGGEAAGRGRRIRGELLREAGGRVRGREQVGQGGHGDHGAGGDIQDDE